MNTRIRFSTMLFFVTGVVLLSRPSAGDIHSTHSIAFESRAKRLLAYYASASTTPGFQAVCAKLAAHIDEANAMPFLETVLGHPTGDMFYIYPLIGTYLHFQDVLPAHIQHRIKELFSMYTPYRGDTENHWLMYYTAIYLAAQTWPHESGAFWFNGKTSKENLLEAKGYLEHWIDITTTRGQGEFDSPHYAGVFFSPLTLLFDFAEDPEMRLKAHMMLDYLLADMAGEHLKGMPCGGASRVYEPEVYTPRMSSESTLMWLYFGDCVFQKESTLHDAIFPSLSSYRCPEIIIACANDRSEPFVHRETKRVRNRIRYSDVLNPPVYKYNYMTENYCLGSLQGGILQPIQQHTWNVTWVSEKPNPRLFTLHPYFSPRELATFFPEEPQILVDDVLKSKGTYNKPDKWTGGSPFEKTFQHKNVIIVLYDIQKGEGWPHMDGFFPYQLEERKEDDSGWIFCREGAIFIACRPLCPYQWIQEKEGMRLRSPYLRNGIIVEVSDAKSYQNFGVFKKQILLNDLDLSRFKSSLTVSYTTSDGELMTFEYNGKRLLNGKPVQFEEYGLFSSPHFQSGMGSGKLQITYGRSYRILDFKNVSLLEGVLP